MGMGIYARNKKLWVDFRFKGVRCREPLGFPDTKANRKYAENKLGEIENKIASDTFIYSDYFADSSKCALFGCRTSINITVKELFAQWLSNAEKRLKADLITQSTFNNYKNEVGLFLEMFGSLNIRSITKSDITDFITAFSIGRKPKSVNNALTTIGQVFGYAVDKEYLSTRPVDRVKRLKMEKPDIYPFTAEEMFQVIDAFKDHRIYPLIATMFYTGMRTGEVLAMKWENIDFNNWTYHIKQSYSKRKLSKTKTIGSTRIINLSKPMQQILKAQKAVSFLRSEFIFITNRGKPFTSSGNIIKMYWKPALLKLGIEYRIPYQCRHTFAVLSLKAGDDPEQVAKSLGHTSLKMLFTHYARFLKDNERKESKFTEMVTNRSQSQNTEQQTTDNKNN